MIQLRASLVLLLTFLLAGCDEASPSGLPTTKMKLGNSTFTLEIAADDRSRQKGLMERDSMPDMHGMIFIFQKDEPRSFWMKNTRFPLDIIYVNSNREIVSIHQMMPYVRETTPSDAPAKYAIELNVGKAKEAGLKAGQKIDFPAGLPESKD